jgi:hypothetical protein
MTNGGNYPGTNSLGDLDLWSFTANAGDNIVLRLGTFGFDGNRAACVRFQQCAIRPICRALGLWTRIVTNQFDQFEVLTYTNLYDPALRQEYFRFLVP